jgi:hypothetical protein
MTLSGIATGILGALAGVATMFAIAIWMSGWGGDDGRAMLAMVGAFVLSVTLLYTRWSHVRDFGLGSMIGIAGLVTTYFL